MSVTYANKTLMESFQVDAEGVESPCTVLLGCKNQTTSVAMQRSIPLSPPVFQLLSINVFKPTALLSSSTSPTTPPCLSHPFPLSLYLGLSCCAAMQWIDCLAWLQILLPNRHKSSPEREANRTMCCIIKSAVLPGGITARSERARGKRGERKNPRKHTNTDGVRYRSYFHDRSDYLKTKTKNRRIMGKFIGEHKNSRLRVIVHTARQVTAKYMTTVKYIAKRCTAVCECLMKQLQTGL